MIADKWTKYLGVAASEVHDERKTTLEVFCPEFTPLAEGEITAVQSGYKVGLKTHDDKPLELSVRMSKTILTYFIGASGVTVPHIHLGEQVWIHNYAGTDKFYWSPTGRNNENRKTEIQRFFVADRQNIKTPLNEDNTYNVILDSVNKKIRIFTRIADDAPNKELFAYDIELDSKTGNLSMFDNIGNTVVMNSNVPSITTINKNGAMHSVVGNNILAYAPHNINYFADGNIVLSSAKAMTLVSKSMAIKTTSMDITTAALGITSAAVNVSGALSAGSVSSPSISHSAEHVGLGGTARPALVLPTVAKCSYFKEGVCGYRGVLGTLADMALKTLMSMPMATIAITAYNSGGKYVAYAAIDKLVDEGKITEVAGNDLKMALDDLANKRTPKGARTLCVCDGILPSEAANVPCPRNTK